MDHTHSDHVQFRLAHRALQSQQQAVIEDIRVVDAVFVQDQRVVEGTEFEQPVPVSAVSREPGYFETKHDAGATHADFCHQLAEAITIHYRSPRLAQVTVDHRDLFLSPAKVDCALSESVLTFRAFRVLEHLPQRRLPHVEICVPFQMNSLHFIV